MQVFICMPYSSLRQRKYVRHYVLRTFLLYILLSKTCVTFSFLYRSPLHRPIQMTVCPHGGVEPVMPIIHQDAKHSWCMAWVGTEVPIEEQLTLHLNHLHHGVLCALSPLLHLCTSCPGLRYNEYVNTHDFCVCVFNL